MTKGVGTEMHSEGHSGCYCCAKPTLQTTGNNTSTNNSNSNNSGGIISKNSGGGSSSSNKGSGSMSMDIDAALSELGMLSMVTDSRRQLLRERGALPGVAPTTPLRHRDRQLSEPSVVSATPPNSPHRGAYQVLRINPQYVTSVTAAPPAADERRVHHGAGVHGCLDNYPLMSAAQDPFSLPMPAFGAKYSQDTLERDSRTSRLSRVKLARQKRFRRPYDVPWWQAPELSRGGAGRMGMVVGGLAGASALSPGALIADVSLPERLARAAAEKMSNSNASTPEKPTVQRKLSLQRSRSLDELDLAKMQLAEAENHNIVLQKQEIDNMSHHLRNLQVTE